MEEFSRLGDGGAGGGGGTTERSFLYLPSASASGAASTSSATPPRAAVNAPSYYSASTSQPNYLFQTPTQLPPPPPPPHSEAGSSQLQKRKADDETPQRDMEEIKAKIASHPQYSLLLGAFMNCQKVGAPPEVVAHLSAIAQELASSPSGPSHRRHDRASHDPELDRFMESYCDVLVKYREELAKPLQEAKDFLEKIETQFHAITNAAARGLLPGGSDEQNEGAAGSSDEERQQEHGHEHEQEEGSGGEGELDPAHAEDKELKNRLLNKYGGYLSSLWQELSEKKKKKGKLPKDARQKLLSWWELHYKWPYPSETEKVALAESTGLDQKQINNWFINQRKRHWKPSEDVQFVVMDSYHHHHHHHHPPRGGPSPSAAALYMEAGQFTGDGTYQFC